MFLRAVSALILFSIFFTLQAQAQSENRLFKKISPLIFRVKSALTPDAPKASYGSGFVVDQNGFLITNYHVISDSVQKTSGYQNYVIIDGKSLPAKILALDVVHDLALLKVNYTFAAVLPLVQQDPTQGESIYSFGIPLDLNLSIVNGLFNGFRKIGPYNQMQMSTPINSGMSGGPTTDKQGRLVGVNVSSYSSANNLTFAVPWRYVKELIQQAKTKPFETEEKKEFHQRIEDQLVVAQEQLMQETVNGFKDSKIGQWTVPEVPNLFKCWMVKKQEELKVEARKVDVTERICAVEQEVFLNNNDDTLNFAVRLMEVSNLKLNPLQFGTFVSETLNHPKWLLHERQRADEEDRMLESLKCDEFRAWNKNKLPFTVSFCSRAYVNYPRLYETFVKFAYLDQTGKNSLLGRLRVDGFTQDNIKKFVKEFLDHVSKKN